MLNVNPYLNFDGTCENAFKFYKAVFGGEFSALMRFKEMPPSEQAFPEGEGDRIMHVALPIGGNTILMGSDISRKMGQKLNAGNNVYVSLHPESKSDAQRLYETLSSGGAIEMPLKKMFWGSWFASFKDRYGIQWMISCED